MASSTFQPWPDLLEELQAVILNLLSEPDIFEFAKTSSAGTKLAHEVAFRRGIASRLQWRKLLAVGTMAPERVHGSTDLILEGHHSKYRDLFSHIARSLFALARSGRKVEIDKIFFDDLLDKTFNYSIGSEVRQAPLEALSVFIPCMTDSQVEKFYLRMHAAIGQCSYEYKQLGSNFYKNAFEFLDQYRLDALQLLVLRLSKKQLADLAELHYFDLTDILVSQQRVDHVFLHNLLPALTHNDASKFYCEQKRVEMFLKLYRHLNPAQKESARYNISIMLSAPDRSVAYNAHRVMQAVAPDELAPLISKGICQFKAGFLSDQFFSKLPDIQGNYYMRWEFACERFATLVPGLRPDDLDCILVPLKNMLENFPGSDRYGPMRYQFYRSAAYKFLKGVVTLLKGLAFLMSDTQRSMFLPLLQAKLSQADEQTHHLILSAFAPLLQHANPTLRTPFFPKMRELFKLCLPSDRDLLRDIMNVLAQDMSAEDAANFFEADNPIYIATIPRLSKERLPAMIVGCQKTPWLFLYCIYLRITDLSDDLLRDLLPQIVSLLFSNRYSHDVHIYDMAEKIIISFTSRPTVRLSNDMLETLFKGVWNSYSANERSCYNVWSHLMKLGIYDLRLFNARLRNVTETKLVHFLDAARDSLQPSTPDLRVTASGQGLFRIVPRSPDETFSVSSGVQNTDITPDETKDVSSGLR